jgi:hypothetical protein
MPSLNDKKPDEELQALRNIRSLGVNEKSIRLLSLKHFKAINYLAKNKKLSIDSLIKLMQSEAPFSLAMNHVVGSIISADFKSVPVEQKHVNQDVLETLSNSSAYVSSFNFNNFFDEGSSDDNDITNDNDNAILDESCCVIS